MSTIRAPFALLLSAFVTIAAPPATVDAQAPSLRLFLESERPSFTLGEPVYLIARLRNETTKPARLIPLLNPRDGLLVVTLTGPRGERLGFVPLTVGDNDLAPTELAAGAQIAASFPVFFGAEWWTLKTPGIYIARARFTVHDGSGRPSVVFSDSLAIRVGDQPAEAARVLMAGNEASRQAGKFLLWSGGDHLAAGQALLATLPRQLGTAPVVDHYRLALGRSLARPFKDYTKGAVRPANYERAIVELLQVRDDVLPAYLKVQKYLALATSYRALGRAAEFTRAATTARTLIAGRPELAEFQEQLDRLGTTPTAR